MDKSGLKPLREDNSAVVVAADCVAALTLRRSAAKRAFDRIRANCRR